jgi:hypothetical protein
MTRSFQRADLGQPLKWTGERFLSSAVSFRLGAIRAVDRVLSGAILWLLPASE